MTAVMGMGPRYLSALELGIASSAHEDYHPRAIQLHGEYKIFDATTTSKDVYKQWELPKRPPPTAHPARTLLPFSATSAYKDSFPAHPPQAVHNLEAVPYKSSGVKFDAESTYHNNYPAFKIEPRPRPPPVAAKKNPARFDGTTTNGETYKAHSIEPRQAAVNTYVYEPTRFDATTEKMESYKAWELLKRQPPIAPPMRPTLPFEATTTSQNEFKGWQLPASRGSLGLAVKGDRMHVLIPAQAKGPCTVKQVFTTVHPGQSDVALMLYQGESQVASRNKQLGQFHLVGLPQAPVGVPQIEVTFHLSEDNIFSAEARELDSGRHHLWQSEGAMLVNHVHAEDVSQGAVQA